MDSDVLWRADEKRRQQSRLAAFINTVNERHQCNLPMEYEPLWEWSINHRTVFWDDVWDFFNVIGNKDNVRHDDADRRMPGACFFAGATLNIAENYLRAADNRPAIIAWDENGRQQIISRLQLLQQTRQVAGWLHANGVRPGDSVVAYLPNIPQTVVSMLAAASIGAVFSSCSMDFGADSVIERLQQTNPKILITATDYQYQGKTIARGDAVVAIARQLPSLRKVALVSPLKTNAALSVDSILWEEILNEETTFPGFYQGDFNAPLLALFSSGTTGKPKCILHRAGGVLLQHLKELGLHTDIHAGDKVFYFTTCGWMMWNWLISALALEAALVLYEGNPLYPSPSILWELAAQEEITMFGTSAKYLETLRIQGIKPARARHFPSLKTICSTGSPLLAEGFDYVYENIKADVHLASISGGTDIVSCFILGNPLSPVRRGELQCRGLAMAVAVYDDAGQEIIGEAGELVCARPFPTTPIGFLNDPDGSRYRAAYYEHFANVWRHGDWAILTSDGGMIILGRSDATLNPGGARIGTAEIYHPVQAFDEVAEALAVGQQWQNDTRIILFVRLLDGANLDEDLRQRLRAAIRAYASPRHVPAKIIAAPDFPRTRSNKISEIAVREMIHQRPINNINALANPDSLKWFENMPELSV